MGSTQGSIWRHFFRRRVPSYLAPRAFYAASLAALSPTSLMDRFAFHLRLATWKWIFWPIFAHRVEHTRTFPQNFSNCKSPASKKSYGCSKIRHFTLFAYANLGGAFSHFHLKAWLEMADLAEFLTFFTKRGLSNIAAFRLKIGRTYALLQPFKATSGWNFTQLC